MRSRATPRRRRREGGAKHSKEELRAVEGEKRSGGGGYLSSTRSSVNNGCFDWTLMPMICSSSGLIKNGMSKKIVSGKPFVNVLM